VAHASQPTEITILGVYEPLPMKPRQERRRPPFPSPPQVSV